MKASLVCKATLTSIYCIALRQCNRITPSLEFFWWILESVRSPVTHAQIVGFETERETSSLDYCRF